MSKRKRVEAFVKPTDIPLAVLWAVDAAARWEVGECEADELRAAANVADDAADAYANVANNADDAYAAYDAYDADADDAAHAYAHVAYDAAYAAYAAANADDTYAAAHALTRALARLDVLAEVAQGENGKNLPPVLGSRQ